MRQALELMYLDFSQNYPYTKEGFWFWYTTYGISDSDTATRVYKLGMKLHHINIKRGLNP